MSFPRGTSGFVKPDWNYRPSVIQPLVTMPATTTEFVPPDPCFAGHDYFESQMVPGVVFCGRCARAVTLCPFP